ncbi:MAG TPA: aquaporin [Chitinophagales bacterium]|nr:aquaporin [Chitinophagales bacterium]HMX05064.1 aquaporin [Chitinophagales bacterium]HNF67825.1 aquaporin [Chitinophagales bacterium]HNM09301.1 aquaporin [Chitinophagales bacterium]
MRNYVAEALGTFAILFFGTGAAIVDSITGGTVSHVGISVTFGFTVMSMIYVFGNTSGAHFNPAVTIAFYFSGRFPGKEILPYVIAQFLGAIAGSGLLLFLFPDAATRGETVPSRDVLQAFVLEGVLTFFLMLTIIHVAHGSKEQGMFAGLAIGSVVLMAALFAGPICGASMNPARSLAPALMSGNLQSIWIYLTAPVLGAVGAVLGWKWLRR